MMVWIEFFISSLLIIVAGVHLTRYADFLSEKTNIAKAWIGVVLLGVVTSLPEAVTSFVSVVYLAANDLAIGNILGSNNFNPLMIVVMDIVYRQGSVTDAIRPGHSHKYSALFAVALNLIVMIELILSRYLSLPAWGTFSTGSVLIILVYFGGIRYLSQSGANIAEIPIQQSDRMVLSFQKIWINIIISAIVVITAAVWLANACDTIALETGLGRTFVGTIFLAIVTSLPEMVVVISAIKLGSADLAIGNIFGSNMINIFILAVCGFFSQSGPILYNASLTHVFTASIGIVLTYLVWVGLQFENKKTFLGLGLDSIIMILIFITAMGILYALR